MVFSDPFQHKLLLTESEIGDEIRSKMMIWKLVPVTEETENAMTSNQLHAM
jgi:hypothetical protein